MPTRFLRMTREVYDEIRQTIGLRPAENGGALGREEDDDVIRYYVFDDTAHKTGATYSPNHELLNKMFKSNWNPRGIRLAGFVHSHPAGFTRPSRGDLYYADRILAAIPDLPALFLPIVQTVPDTRSFKLRAFVALREDGQLVDHEVELEIVDDEANSRAAKADAAQVMVPDISGDVFDRVKNAYDLDRLARARVVIVGVGGAASFAEDLARCGTGEFVLIDDDRVSVSNIATQQVYLKDVGRPKVEALADRLRDINPWVRVTTVPESLDSLDDSAIRAICLDPVDHSDGRSPSVTLLCGLTDNFLAQARVNALALNFGLPSLCAQVWQEGRGAEVTFTYPGLTSACHRCILSARYDAYLKDGYRNTVTSHGTPIFATTRLNAIKGFIALALLHHDSTGSSSRFAGLAGRIGNRNMLQIRMDPDLAVAMPGIRTFRRVFGDEDNPYLFFDETVWLPQQVESGQDGSPRCPDCHGTGDLRDAIGTFDDTRKIRDAGR